VAPASQGAEPGYEISVGVGQSDNVYLTSANRKSDTLFTQGVDFTWHDQRPSLTADIDANLSYLEFLNHTFNNQLLGNFLGDARFTLAPVLFWDISDNFGQGRVNPLAQATPGNQENINYLSTGPELKLPLGGDTLLDVQTHYAHVSYQVSPLNSNRFSGQVGILHQLSANSGVSVNVRDERVDYANLVANQDYSRQDAFGRLDAKGVRTTLAIDLGVSRLRGIQSPTTGLLARVEASRRISASSVLALMIARQYSDAADSFRLGQTLSGANVVAPQGVTASGTPFTSDLASLAWNFQKQRTGFGLEASYNKDSYHTLFPSQDDKRIALMGHVTRQLTPTLSVTLQDQYQHETFIDAAGFFTENNTDLIVAWRMARRLTLTFDYNHDIRHSDLPGTAYTDNRAWVLIGYGRPAQIPPGPATPPLPSTSRLY